MRKITLLFSSLMFIFALGCDAEDDYSVTERSFPAGSYWDKVRCDVDDIDHCYGHRAGTDADLWSQVYSRAYIDNLVTLGMLELSSDGWDKSTCDPGSEPSTAPDVQCYQFVNTTTRVCLAGDDGWLSKAYPSCDVGSYTQDDYWSAGSCTTTLGDYGYDEVYAHTSNANKARAFIDTDAFDVVPECYAQQFGLVGMNPDSATPAWPGLECWITGGGDICLGTRDGSTVHVVAPSEVAVQYPAGTWVPDGSPGCTVDPVWESVDCYYEYGFPSNRVCLGLLDNVRVISADPCSGPWAGHIQFHGLWALPDDPANYNGYNSTDWEG